MKKDWHFIAVCLIALIFVLYSFLGSGTADAIKACNEYWMSQWNASMPTPAPNKYLFQNDEITIQRPAG